MLEVQNNEHIIQTDTDATIQLRLYLVIQIKKIFLFPLEVYKENPKSS